MGGFRLEGYILIGSGAVLDICSPEGVGEKLNREHMGVLSWVHSMCLHVYMYERHHLEQRTNIRKLVVGTWKASITGYLRQSEAKLIVLQE